MDPMADELRDKGHNIDTYEYPIRYAVSLYWPGVAKGDGLSLAQSMDDGDNVIAHSYGCLMVLNSILAGAKWDKVFLFGGAATSDKFYYPDDAFSECYVVYNPEDSALKFGSLLPFHPFGKMGLRGITGQPGRDTKDPRIKNIRGFRDTIKIDHSHYWEEDLDKWVDFLDIHLSGIT
jgi:hypothetical protein